MVEKSMKEFAKAIREEDIVKIGELTEEIIQEKGGKKLDLEEVSELDDELVKKIKENGINTVEKLANSPLKELVKIPELREGKAKEVLGSAREHLVKILTELPGVGKSTAREILKRGYATLRDVGRAPVEELSEIPKIEKKEAVEIKEYAEKNSGTGLEDLPKVGKKTAEGMRKNNFTAMQSVAESSLGELTKVPNIGAKGAEEVLEYAKENPQDDLKNLPGVGEGTTEKLKRHGFTVIHRVADTSVEELAETPNIGEKGARKIKDYAGKKLGGRIEDLSNLNEGTIEELQKLGYTYIGDVAKSSVEELVEIPGLEQGRAKELLESVKEKWEESGEIKGYRRALEGVSAALKSDESLTLAQKIADGKYSEEGLEKIKEERASKIAHEFRPPTERGFNEAWRDILEAVLAIEY